MKEVVVTGPKQYEVREVPIPQVSAGELLLKMRIAGVCGSDIHLFLGENPNAVYPRVPGHENIAEVVEIGPGVEGFELGDRVAVDLVHACGHCPQCLSGRKNICRTVRARGASMDGGWREYFVVPQDEAYIVPDSIEDRQAVLIEPFAIGGQCTKRAGAKAGDTALVLGAGTIGSIILQTLKAKGCTVYSADINDSSLNRAKTYGADATINTKTENLKEIIQELTDGNGVDLAFDSACFPGSLALLAQPGVTTNGATIVTLGFVTENEPINQAMITSRELSIVGSRMSSGQFVPTIQKFAEGTYNLEGIISHYIPFNQIDRVFDLILNPPKDMKKIAIEF